ncbi:MAG: SDR family oxidoreductase, partial [Opitutae bacterium]|nr:SDR family oxidoreductase [Opitutae bacterium]
MNNDTNSLNKKKVLITGGGSGMGRAIALSMAEEGASVGICGRRKDALLETINLVEIVSKPKEFVSDVTDRSSVGMLFDWFDEEFGSLDILVHAAGLNIVNRSMQELEPEDWDQLIETNLTGSFNILTPALKRMREKQKGLIILINSVAGRRATPLAGIAYNCS